MRMSQAKMLAGKNLVMLPLFFGTVPALQAGQFAYGLGYTATQSDNIARETTNERSELVHSYLAGFSYLENTADLVARVFAQATYFDYHNDIFSDESVYNLNSSLIWTISPQRFTWTVEDTYEESQISATAADTPSNRTSVNVFNTGPDFYARLNPVNTLALGLRAGNVSADQSNIDNDRFSALARWLYQANSSMVYSLNAQALSVSYDDSVTNVDYDRRDFFIRADYKPGRSQYTLDLGTSRITPDRGQEIDGTLARFTLVRQLTQESNFGLSASSEYADTGTDILAASTAEGLSAGTPAPALAVTTSDVVTSDVYYARRVNVFYTRRASQFWINASANTQDLDFETTAQDREEKTGILELDFFYSGATSVKLFTEQTRTEFLNFSREDTDRNSGIRFGYRVNRNVSLELEGRRIDRTSTVSTAEFEENRVFFSVLYSSSPLFTPVYTR